MDVCMYVEMCVCVGGLVRPSQPLSMHVGMCIYVCVGPIQPQPHTTPKTLFTHSRGERERDRPQIHNPAQKHIKTRTAMAAAVVVLPVPGVPVTSTLGRFNAARAAGVAIVGCGVDALCGMGWDGMHWISDAKPRVFDWRRNEQVFSLWVGECVGFDPNWFACHVLN